MAVRNAPRGNDGDWIDWVELGGDKALVALTLTRWDPEEDLGNGPLRPAICDVLVVTGDMAGVVRRSEKIIGRGITTPLSKIDVGDTMAARLETKKRGTTIYAVAQECTEAELAKVVEAMENPPEPEAPAEAEKATAGANGKKARPFG